MEQHDKKHSHKITLFHQPYPSKKEGREIREPWTPPKDPFYDREDESCFESDTFIYTILPILIIVGVPLTLNLVMWAIKGQIAPIQDPGASPSPTPF